MTQLITPQEIPQSHLEVLKRSVKSAINHTNDTYVFLKVPLDDRYSIVAWVGLNDKQQMEEVFFLTDDIVLAPMKVHSSIGLKS